MLVALVLAGAVLLAVGGLADRAIADARARTAADAAAALASAAEEAAARHGPWWPPGQRHVVVGWAGAGGQVRVEVEVRPPRRRRRGHRPAAGRPGGTDG